MDSLSSSYKPLTKECPQVVPVSQLTAYMIRGCLGVLYLNHVATMCVSLGNSWASTPALEQLWQPGSSLLPCHTFTVRSETSLGVPGVLGDLNHSNLRITYVHSSTTTLANVIEIKGK